jgi:uncharacterized protein (TIGR02246 family)
MTDDEQISALFDRMCAAWTAGDAQAYGDCFTTDCDYVSFDGNRAQGREPVVISHDKLFRGVLHGSALVGRIESIRHLTEDVAIVHATGSVLTAWRSTLPRRRLTRNTIVAVRGADGWRFTAIHNGRIRPVHPPEPDSVPARLARALVHASRRLGLGHASAAAVGRDPAPGPHQAVPPRDRSTRSDQTGES